MAQALRNAFEPKGRLVTTAVAYNPEDAGYDVEGMNEWVNNIIENIIEISNVIILNTHKLSLNNIIHSIMSSCLKS